MIGELYMSYVIIAKEKQLSAAQFRSLPGILGNIAIGVPCLSRAIGCSSIHLCDPRRLAKRKTIEGFKWTILLMHN